MLVLACIAYLLYRLFNKTTAKKSTMINEALYKKTVDILFDAYFNDTLEHGDQCCCAFGNIVAANCGIKMTKDNRKFNNTDAWYNVILCSGSGMLNEWFKSSTEALKQISQTGYTPQQCALIEAAFENAEPGNSNNEDEYIFNGLCAVLEVLKEIHQVEDNQPEVTRFNNHYKSKVYQL